MIHDGENQLLNQTQQLLITMFANSDLVHIIKLTNYGLIKNSKITQKVSIIKLCPQKQQPANKQKSANTHDVPSNLTAAIETLLGKLSQSQS